MNQPGAIGIFPLKVQGDLFCLRPLQQKLSLLHIMLTSREPETSVKPVVWWQGEQMPELRRIPSSP